MVQTPEYLPGEFRGLNFFVDSASVIVGRRGALHEYVNQNTGYFEDMGRKAREFSISMFLFGDDHLDQARAFQRALEADGPAELVTPSRLRETVVVTDATRTDDTRREKLITRFDVTFIEAGELQFPSGLLSSIADLLDSVSSAIDAVVQDIAAPILALGAAASRITDAASSVGESVRNIGTIGSSARSVFDAIQEIGDIDASLGLTNFSSAVPPIVPAPIATAEYEQSLVFDATVRITAALRAVSLSTDLDFISRREAVRVRNAVSEALIADLELLTHDQVVAVQRVQRAFITDVQARISVLPNFVRVDFGQSVPSVVAAHQIYGDWTRYEDLLMWNETYHPLFMPNVIEALR